MCPLPPLPASSYGVDRQAVDLLAAPDDGVHCGRCNKCAERQAAFVKLAWKMPRSMSLHQVQ